MAAAAAVAEPVHVVLGSSSSADLVARAGMLFAISRAAP